ncbi:MAG: hypothetical protein ACRC2T_10560, partial [Thermoguttaceae bacterium]
MKLKLLCTIFFLVLTLFTFSYVKAADSFTIEAWAFDEGNAAVFTEQYRAGGPPIIANGSATPNRVEYAIPFPVAGKYEFSVFSTMGEVRQVTVYLDDEVVGTVCNGPANGSWDSVNAVWDEPITINVPSAGMHTVKLVALSSPFPHIARLKFKAVDNPIPDDWKLSRPKARKLIDPLRDIVNAAKPNTEAMRRSINDLIITYGEKYPNGKNYLKKLDAIEKEADILAKEIEEEKISVENATPKLEKIEKELDKLRFEAIFTENPAIDFDSVLLVRRHARGPSMGMPMNWESNSSLPKSGYDDEIMLLELNSLLRKGDNSNDKALSPETLELTSVFKPNRDTLVSDVDLNFDADKLMFSAVGDNNRWHVFEYNLSDKSVKQLTNGDSDIDFYDSCYLPDGRIMLTCTAPMVGVPCVFGSSHVANLFLLDPNAETPETALRQLCFDQEHNWCPTVMPNGRVIYTRWEYTDTPHSNTRLLFH